MNTESRIAVLDGLRALAIILVLLRHSIRPFWPQISDPYIPFAKIDLGSILINGWAGVDLFFVLSGFLITWHLLRGFQGGSVFKSVVFPYGMRRFFRIAPAYYVVLLAVVLGFFPYFPYPESYERIGWRVLYHLAFLQDYWPSDLLVVFWSLAVEIKFYLLAPFLVWGLLKLKDIRVQMLVLAGLVASQPVLRGLASDVSGFEDYFEQVRTAFHLSLDGLLMGMAAAFLWVNARARAFVERPMVAGILLYAGIALFLVLCGREPLVDTGVSWFDKTVLVTLISAAFTMMLLGLMGGAKGHGIFKMRWLGFVALISYSLYLVHVPLLYLAEVIAAQFIDFEAVGPHLGFVLYLPFFAVLSVIAASLLYAFVERPFIVWSKRGFRF